MSKKKSVAPGKKSDQLSEPRPEDPVSAFLARCNAAGPSVEKMKQELDQSIALCGFPTGLPKGH